MIIFRTIFEHCIVSHDAHLVGVFLQEFTARGFVVYEALVGQVGSQKDLFEELGRDDAATFQASVDSFEAACQEAGITFSIHRDRRSARRGLLHESIFADLLVIDAHETFSYIEQDIPGWFLKNILHDAYCPVWLVSAKETIVLSVKSGTLNMHVPDSKLIHEWMKRHFSRAGYKVIQGGEEELLNFCYVQGPEVVVVAGAYERSRVSNWLHPSLADQLMRQVKAPLFITHC